MKPFRIPFIAFALGIAFVFAFLFAGPVFAQDELPPAPEATPAAEPAPAVEEVAPVAAPAEEPPAAPMEEPLPVEEPAVVVVEESAPPVEEPAEEAVPEIVTLDEGGTVLPLASEAAAETLVAGDPYFKDGAIYRGWHDGGGCAVIVLPANCTFIGLFSPLKAALDAYGVSPTATGPIYIEADTYTLNSDLTIDPLLNANYVDLTGLIGTGSGLVTLNFAGTYHMIIRNAPTGFTLQGMTITGNDDGSLVEFTSNKGNLVLTDLVIDNAGTSNKDGLEITGHIGNVSLNTVKADNNGGKGAKITGVTGSVSITNSSFDSNGNGALGSGESSLFVDSTGAITLNGVSASYFTRGNGASLKSLTGITVKNSLFNYNDDDSLTDGYGYGLRTDNDSKGNILMDRVYASSNQMDGIAANTRFGGSVTMNNIEAHDNDVSGVGINNCFASGGLCTTTTGAVTLSNLNLYNNDYGNLRVIANGAITVNAINAHDATNTDLSNFGGIFLDNFYAKSASAVTLKDAYSTNNYSKGVWINSKGSVSLDHVRANNNTGDGIVIGTTGSVTIASTLGINESSSNTSGSGTYITANGAVSISLLNSTSNKFDNLRIINTGGSGSVTVTGGNIDGDFVGNFNNSVSGSGIFILSKGAITVTNARAEGNSGIGFALQNQDAGSAQPVTVKTTATTQDVYLENNGNYALAINSRGNVSVSGINLWNGSGQSNIYIANNYGTGTVTLGNSTVHNVDDPSDNGAVYILSNGAVTISNLSTTNNMDRGLYINNYLSGGTPGVTITGLITQSNIRAGFEIKSKGPVKVTNVTASNTTIGGGYANGGYIDTMSGGAAGTVTLDTTGTKWNEFYSNTQNGLEIHAGGVVVVKDAFIYYNTADGLSISGNGTVTITNPYINQNDTGIRIENFSGGAGVTVSGPDRSATPGNASVFSNTTANMVIDTHGKLTLNWMSSYGSKVALSLLSMVGDVNLNHISFTTIDTGGDVITLVSNGTVIATDVTTNSSIDETITPDLGSGLSIDNRPANGKPVTITNFEDSSGKGVFALTVLSKGAISLSNFYVNGDGNRDSGIILNNWDSTTNAGVAVKLLPTVPSWWVASNFIITALDIASHGSVIVDNLSLSYSGTGLKINTDHGSVTVTNTDSNSNTNGINITAGGAITLTNIDAYENSAKQVVLNNFGASVASPVTVTGLDAWGWTSPSKGTVGLEIDSKGAVTLTNIDVSQQKISGYGLDINTTGSVTISTTGTNRNNLTWNQVSGGVIIAGGNVYISKLDANNAATGSGLEITTSAGSITITDSNFNTNKTYGLLARITAGTGGITLTNVDAKDNKDSFGATLMNYPGTGPITINGLSVGDKNLFTGNEDSNLFVETNGAVTMNYVDASNAQRGIYFPQVLGNVVMNYVDVNNFTADDYGIQLVSNGTVSLSHIHLYTPSLETPLGGISIDNYGTSLAKNVSLLDIYIQTDDGDVGIYVHSKGAITAKDFYISATTTGKRLNGIFLDNSGSPVKAGVTLGVVTRLKNTVEFSDQTGMEIISDGPVTIDKTEVKHSGQYGLRINNRMTSLTGVGGVLLTNSDFIENGMDGVSITTNGTVVLTGVTSTDNGTASDHEGLNITVGETPSHFSGTVTLTNITATNNWGDEIRVEALKQVTIKKISANDYGPGTGKGTYIHTTAGVSIVDPGGTTWNEFKSNNGNNLEIQAVGAVTLAKIYTDWSVTANGVTVATVGNVTLTNLTAHENVGYGLNVSTKGAISATGLYIDDNNTKGALLVNNLTGAIGGVTVSSSTFYNNTIGGADHGLEILTNGAVLLNQVSSTDNSGYGAVITVSGLTATVTINKSEFSQNSDDGLNVDSQGNITLNGVTANGNYNSNTNGVKLDNVDGGGAVSVLATLGANEFSSNNLNGLTIVSNGVVTINKTTANTNQYGDGVDVHTLGAITVNNITASWNGGSGAAGNGMILDNHLGSGAVSVLATLGKNSFSSNRTSGLDISTSKAVVINSVTASSNSNGAGINVDNHWAAVAGTGTVTVTGAMLQANNREGIMIASNGIATLTGVEAILNGSGGTNSGIKISTNGFNALVQNSVSMLNYKNGIEANVGGATPPLKLTVKGCIFWNNNRSGGSNPNLLINSGGLLEIIL